MLLKFADGCCSVPMLLQRLLQYLLSQSLIQRPRSFPLSAGNRVRINPQGSGWVGMAKHLTHCGDGHAAS